MSARKPSYWREVSFKDLVQVSNGFKGIWGVDKDRHILQRLIKERKWVLRGKGVQVSCGASVWKLDAHDRIYKLAKNVWKRVPGALRNIDVSNKGRVWGVNRSQNIYRRKGSAWQKLEGRLVQVSVGGCGVWGVNKDQNIYYREGTFGDVDTGGKDWIKVPGKLKWVASGQRTVVGVNSNNDVYLRMGISPAKPTGVKWVKVDGKLVQCDMNQTIVIGVNSQRRCFRFKARDALKARL